MAILCKINWVNKKADSYRDTTTAYCLLPTAKLPTAKLPNCLLPTAYCLLPNCLLTTHHSLLLAFNCRKHLEQYVPFMGGIQFPNAHVIVIAYNIALLNTRLAVRVSQIVAG